MDLPKKQVFELIK